MKKIALILGLFALATLQSFSPVPEQRIESEHVSTIMRTYLEHLKTDKNIKIDFYANNNNPFNIRSDTNNLWKGEIRSTDPFVRFQSQEYGLRAGFKLLLNYQEHYNLHTIEQIVHRFAPPHENNTEHYIQWMSEKTGFSRDQKLPLHQEEYLIPFCKFMIEMETGRPIDSVELKKVYTKYFT